MNFFLTPTGILPTCRTADELLNLLLDDISEEDVPQEFRTEFAALIKCPNVLFCSRTYTIHQLASYHGWAKHIVDESMNYEERMVDAAAQNIVYVVSGIRPHSNEQGFVLQSDAYTLSSNNVNAAMRQEMINELLTEL